MRGPNLSSPPSANRSDDNVGAPARPARQPHTGRRSARQLRAIAFSFAIAGGLVAMLFSTWPLPVLRGYEHSVFVTWGVIGDIVGPTYFVGAYLIRKGLRPASVVLSLGGLFMIGAWLLTGRLVAVSMLEHGWLGLTVDMLPIMLAAGAAWLVLANMRSSVAPVGVPIQGSGETAR